MSNPSINWRTLSITCDDADRTAALYSQLLGWEIDRRGDVDAETGRSGWVTLRNPADGIRLACGRSESYQPPDRNPDELRVILDPAGHPLCLFQD